MVSRSQAIHPPEFPSNFDAGPEQRFSILSAAGVPEGFPQTDVLCYSSWKKDGTDKPLETPKDFEEDFEEDLYSQSSTVNISNFLNAMLLDPLPTPQPKSQSVSVLVENGASTGGRSLYRDQVTSAVILQDPTYSGDSSDAVLAHLPHSVRREQTFVSLLNFRSTDEWIRMVWNKGAQESYSVHDEVNPYLPSIISRKRVLASEVDTAKRLRSG
jgi:hypothetical protein